MSEVYGSAPVLSLEEGAGVSMKRMIPSSGGPISGKGSSWTSPSVPSVPSAPSASTTSSSSKKKKRGSERVVGVKGEKGLEGVVDSEAYMDLVIFEKKLDSTIMRKRLDIQEALKRPVKQKRKLRIFLSSIFLPGKEEEDGTSSGGSWELRVEGRLLTDEKLPSDFSRNKKKFSSFIKSLVIELDKEMYGPDNYLVEWHRSPSTQETDGFQVKRPGDKNVRCTIILILDHQPLQYKVDPRLARLLGLHTQTRPVIVSALWQYIKSHNLQDPHEREYICCNSFLKQIFQTDKMKFAELPQRLNPLLYPPDPIVINHVISVEDFRHSDQKKTACFDIDVELDDTLKTQMNSFLLSTSSQQEILSLNSKIHETVNSIVSLKTSREFYLRFANNPQLFISKWITSQSRNVKAITDTKDYEQRKTDFYYQAWAQEAVCRYFYNQVKKRGAELGISEGFFDI